jgi:phospholipid N-methyltransferase
MINARDLEDRLHKSRARRQTKTADKAATTRHRNHRLRFLAEFAREPLRVGALCPSSRSLAQVVVNSCDIKSGATVVELGAGTGAFTGLLSQRVNGCSRLFAVEINSMHAAFLKQRFPRCEVIHDSAENLPRHLGGRLADCVVSGLAWGNMLPGTQDRILRVILDSLTENGQFVAFAYVHAAWFPTSLHFRRKLLKHFKRVETTPTIWRNLPPAFVFRCRRE